MVKSKSRTSTSKKKNLKLKWWYVLPVIAIVAIAGYAVVRFSEAGAAGLVALRTVDSGLNCSQGTIVDKTAGGSQNRICSLPGGKTASATWPSREYKPSRYRSFCADVNFGPNAAIIIRSQMRGSLIPDRWTSSQQISYPWPNGGFLSVCSGPWLDNPNGTWDLSTSAKLEVTNNGGTISVVRMYIK